ncbi:MAG: hypothetical protein ABW214_06635 [Terrimicrobiaceae bacterium]|jgi:hypothetical protein
MKSIRHFILKVTRKNNPVCRQMELSLPGSRLTRDEANFMREIRQVRERLAVSRT